MLASLHQLLTHQSPKRIVWTADLTYWIAGQPPELVAEKGWDTETGHLKLCRDLGILPYYWYENFWAGELHSDRVTIHDVTYPNGLHRKTWHTPFGTLIEESYYQPESFSQAITRYPVQDPDDLKILLSMLEHSQAVPTNLDTYPTRRKAWAEYGGLPSLAMPRSPLPAFLAEWAGVERGIYLLMDEPEQTNAVLDQLERLEEPIVDGLSSLACQIAPDLLLVHFADNLTSEVYTPFFTSHMARRYEQRLERLHAAGIRGAVHLDGTVRGLLPRLAATDLDAIEALTPQPVGDVSVEEMRRLSGSSSVILWGGLPGAMFAPPFTWEDLQCQVERTLKAWRGTPFILGTADQVPPNGEIDFVRRISEMIAERQE
jgi:hypothetical protein